MMQRTNTSPRGVLAPNGIDERPIRHQLTATRSKNGEQHALLTASHGNHTRFTDKLERPQQAHTHQPDDSAPMRNDSPGQRPTRARHARPVVGGTLPTDELSRQAEPHGVNEADNQRLAHVKRKYCPDALPSATIH